MKERFSLSTLRVILSSKAGFLSPDKIEKKTRLFFRIELKSRVSFPGKNGKKPGFFPN